MPTNSAGTSATAASRFVTDTLRQSTLQFFGALTQTTKMGFDTASAIVDTLFKVTSSLPALPMAPDKEKIKEWLGVGYETTENLLKLEKDLLIEMMDRLPGIGS